MSEKKRKRGRPRTTPSLSYGTEFKLRNKEKRIIKKPKYLREPDEEDDLELGENSTPSIKTDSIPENGRNSSKYKNSRGYNPLAYNELKDSEYHYGSDFEYDDISDNMNSNVSSDLSDVSSSSELEDVEETTSQRAKNVLENFNATSPMWWKLGPAGNLGIRAHSPIPVWLQDRIFPTLDLPKSSDDLLIPTPLIMKAISIYEILRHFRTLVRLSPFLFEDFCGMLLAEEQSSLLTEIHISLLKVLIRDEEIHQTHFGPLDNKDSINILFYSIDSLTWPEVLRLYLQSDPEFKHSLKILDSSNYPFASVTQRLDILQFLCDQFLQSSLVREDLMSEGRIKYDDHCRFCHKTGDLLCCDSCNAVYHLDCVDPPLMHSPAELEDWTCAVCKQQEVKGVTDCLSPMESSGFLCRQEPLGYDRHGRKYWFLIRRIFVESEEGIIYYYSTVEHFELILTLLDKDDLEEGLFIALREFGEDIRRQMGITVELTNKAKGNKASWLAIEKENVTEETETMLKLKFKKDSEAFDSMIEKVDVKEEIKKENTDESTSDKEIASHASGDDNKGDTEPKPEIKEEIEVKEEEIGAESDVKPDDGCKKDLEPPDEKDSIKQEVKADQIPKLIKEKQHQLFSNICNTFRLGCDNSHRSYSNVYTSNLLALNKIQHQEERDKKRHLSYKFSVNSNTEFKWSGQTFGSTQNIISTMRATLLSLESNVSSFYFHPNWQHIRKIWSQFVFQSSEMAQLSKALRILSSCIKPVVYSSSWNESLGHIRLKRITALEREEKKKQEKKERKDTEDEKVFFFIKYTKGAKHQLWKVKGEEYRLHGLWGWIWNSSIRRVKQVSMFDQGLRAGPDKVTLPIKSQTGSIRGLPIAPASYKQLISNNPFLAPSLLSSRVRKLQSDYVEIDHEKGHEIVVANSGIQQKVEAVPLNLDDYLEDGLVNISKNLNSRNRLVYPKVAKPSTLDGLLTRRIGLKLQEERELATKKVESTEDDTMVDVESDATDSSISKSLQNSNIEELPDSQRHTTVHTQRIAGNLLKEVRTYKQKYEEIDDFDAFHPCYSPTCRSSGRSNCFSPSCLLKERTKQKLVGFVNNYKIVTSNPPPYEQIGSLSPVRFSASDSNDSGSRANSREGTPKIDSSSETKYSSDNNENSQSSTNTDRKSTEREGRIYSVEKPCGKIYLKKYNVENKKNRKSNFKTPQLSSFIGGDKTEQRYSLLVLPHWELKILARRGGRYNPSHFNPNAKINQSAWSYPCSRPLFKTTWLFRSTRMSSFSAAALQIKILWSCLRWDDMQEKSPTDGRRQITTDAEVIQTEILKRKHSGRFLHKTQYLQRKIIIPFDVPKPVREFTPSQRSGLRKRRRAQSPVGQQPQSLEEWVDEEKLALWEIKHFGERLEKAVTLNKKSSNEKTTNGETNSFVAVSNNSCPNEFKAKIEEQLKIQRANFNQKKAIELQSVVKLGVNNPIINNNKITIGNSPITIKDGTVSSANPGTSLPSLLAGRKIVTTKGGKIITVQATSPKTDNQSPKIALANNSVFPVSNLPKIQLTSQGNKVIRFQTLPPGLRQRAILPRVITPTSVTSGLSTASPIALTKTSSVLTSPTSTPSIRPAGQQIHIIRLPDGQVQVRGLQDGQQVIQRSDGKLQFINKTSTPVVTTTAANLVNLLKSPQKENTVPNITPISSAQIVKINGQQILLRSNNKQIPNVSASESLNLKTTPLPIKAIKTPEGFVLKTPISISNAQSPTILKTITEPKVTTSIPSVSTVTTTSTNSAPSTGPAAGMSNSLTLKVQVRMTEQGPKTIIQGLEPGVGLTKDHILAIQQQVKSMLNQYKLQVNQLSPLMTLTLQVAGKPTQQSQIFPFKSSQPQTVLQTESKTPTLAEPIAFDDTKKITSSAPPLPLKTVPENIFEQDPATEKSPKKFVSSESIHQSKSGLNKDDLMPHVDEHLVHFQKDISTTEDHSDELSPKGTKRTRDKDDEWDELTGKVKKSKAEKTPKAAKKESLSASQASKSLAQDAKKKVVRHQKLDSFLGRHKDLLKKDILKKRALLEKELQLQIHKELSVAKQHIQTAEKSKPAEVSINSKKKSTNEPPSSPFDASAVNLLNQKRNDSLSMINLPINNASKAANKNITKNKKNKGKGKKIVCICRTPFDDTKFYVGCDLCGNWFHGSCVGITEASSRTMTEYVCDDCANAKLNKELFCFCRQPYDESQFYIFCEKCEGWYHGKCIGIMQQEAEDIDDYICPQCDPNTQWNLPCQKKLSPKDYIELKKIAKALIQHKNAWPFLEPVDQSEVPDYYKVVKEPMDLKSIENKVGGIRYSTLAQFCGDVMLVFDNCRAYNPPNSSFWSCANTLENFFCTKLKQLKQKLALKS